jgi:flagellar motor switch protein FliM
MALRQPKTALQRKLARAREGAQTGDRSALRALRQAAGRAARDTMDLTLTVIGATQSRAGQDDLGRNLEDGRLLILMEGPDGLTGGAMLDLPLVSALIQQQTRGAISPGAAAARPFTDTDAALSAQLVETLLRRAADLTQLPADRACLTGYGYGARIEDTHSFALALEADHFRIFDLIVDIASGLHQGSLGLILPEREGADAGAATGALRDAGKPPEGPRLGDRMMTTPAELTAILCRLHLPLDELTAMKPGDRLPLAPLWIEKTELQTISGHFVAAGRLGQSDGYRAIRMNETEFTSEPVLEQVLGSGAKADPAGGLVPGQGMDPRAAAALNARQLSRKDPQSTAFPTEGEMIDMQVADPIHSMTPDQAAAEISELAGLTFGDISGDDQLDSDQKAG